MLRPYLTGPLGACLLMILSGCAGSGTNPTALPPVPADLKVCFDTTSTAPQEGILTKAEVIRLIAELRRSEVEKSLCGKRLIAFYETFI